MLRPHDCLSLLLILSLTCSGCASVVSGRHADVDVFSNVKGAEVTIHDKKGLTVATTTTPGTVTLRRQPGVIRPKGYTATISAPGHHTEQFKIKQKINPWLYGNIGLFQFGLVGAVVDSISGAAWQPDEKNYYHELTPLQGNYSEQLLSEQLPQEPNPSSQDNIQLVSSEAYVSDVKE